MSSIRPDELDERLAAGDDPFLLDIRPKADFRAKSIQSAHNIPVYTELQRGNESALREQLGEIPADRNVVVVCKMGIVAKRATKLLTEEGYDATTLSGGMSGWSGYQKGSIGYKIRSLFWKLR